ncbi:MAG: hypothetical protein AAF743_11965 [Planctomycetota bacterium]
MLHAALLTSVLLVAAPAPCASTASETATCDTDTCDTATCTKSTIAATVVIQAHAVMSAFVDQRVIDDTFHLYDVVDNRMLELRLDAVHEGVRQQGDFLISSAAFIDQDDRRVDVDFVTLADGQGGMVVTQALVHKIDDVARPYELTATCTKSAAAESTCTKSESLASTSTCTKSSCGTTEADE